MDKEFKIIPLENQDYDYLVIICGTKPLYDYIIDIVNELNTKIPVKILFDQMLHTGNREKRFMSIELSRETTIDVDMTTECGQNNNITSKTFVHIPKNSPIREISCRFIKENGLAECPTLTSIQRRMIEKGIVI